MAAPATDESGIRQTIRALKAEGYTITHVYDGEDDVFAATEADTIAAITAVDDAYLHVKRGEEYGWVRFVMGNEPFEVICDHDTILSPVLDPLMDRWNS